MAPASIESLVANYGTHMHRVIAMADAGFRRCDSASAAVTSHSPRFAYALRDEMVADAWRYRVPAN